MSTRTMSASDSLPLGKILFLATGMAGSFFMSLAAQFAATHIADIQAGFSATPDEASWILTAYSMASFVGIVASGLLIKAFGLGRYMVASALVFAVTALTSVFVPDLSVMIALRAIQGFAAGGLGPAAFVAVFMIAGGSRLPFAVAVLAFVLLFPAVAGPLIAAVVEDHFGWPALFLLQAGIGAGLALAARLWVPQQAPNWPALKTGWAAILLLSVALASLTLVLSQGTRRFWFESDMIVLCTAISIGAWAAFIFVEHRTTTPVVNMQLLASRAFGLPIALNLVFRIGVVAISYVVPQFLAVVQGYRPLDMAELLLWAAGPQLLAFPAVWGLMQIWDSRVVMAFGLMLCVAGAALAMDGTAVFAATQFHPVLILFGVGQLMFLVPALVIGATPLKPADLPTASLAFNMTTLGGTTLGVAFISNLLTERQKFHSNVLTESVSLYNMLDAERIAGLTSTFATRLGDDAGATAAAIAAVATAARRQAWVLSFNDAFLVLAVILAVSLAGVVAISRAPALGRKQAAPQVLVPGGAS